MKTKLLAVMLTFCAGLAMAQQPGVPETGAHVAVGGMGMTTGKHVIMHRELGQWWKNSEIAGKLQLNDGQIAQLDSIYYQHRLKLIDFGADLEKQELKLQELLNAEHADDGSVLAQVDGVGAARSKLEREFTTMTLDLRRVLSSEQWKQLQGIRQSRMPDNVFFQRRVPPPGGGGMETMPLPPMPPEPPDPME